ncbi:hypothetical protein NPIL_424941 [Nephila pilipes]|uniref:Uncharacterized protein n=1 Tax=Nephila pilipes TaxID=299642 RepID=A0A8X6NVY8_NEPPI|nr:hypothetical protein NPIL_424941 [Nephila pilipes]
MGGKVKFTSVKPWHLTVTPIGLSPQKNIRIFCTVSLYRNHPFDIRSKSSAFRGKNRNLLRKYSHGGSLRRHGRLGVMLGAVTPPHEDGVGVGENPTSSPRDHPVKGSGYPRMFLRG